MRSKFHQEFPTTSEEFGADLASLFEDFSEEDRATIVDGTIKIVKSESPKEVGQIQSELMTDSKLPKQKVTRAIKALMFLAHQFDPMNETPSQIVADIIDLELVPKDHEEAARKLLERYFGEFAQDKHAQITKAFANAILPTLVGTTTLVDARLVYKDTFSSLPHYDVDKYTPKFVGWIPVAIIKLRSDTEDTYHFQCNEVSLDRLIANLIALKKDLVEAKARLGQLLE